MYEDLLRELRCCPDAEYGCSRCKHKDSLHCRETLMQESADAIEKLKEEIADKPRWISVKERPPEAFENVFVANKRGKHYDIDKAWWNGSGFDRCAKGSYQNVTHWMPLPEPPKEGGGEE